MCFYLTGRETSSGVFIIFKINDTRNLNHLEFLSMKLFEYIIQYWLVNLRVCEKYSERKNQKHKKIITDLLENTNFTITDIRYPDLKYDVIVRERRNNNPPYFTACLISCDSSILDL